SGRPAASEAMMTTLSPAMVRSPTITWSSLARPAAVKIAPKFRLSSIAAPPPPECLLVHRSEEVLVRLGVLHLVEQELHRIDGAHLHQDPTQHPHLGEGALVDQQFFLAGAGLADVERREDALVGDLTVEHDFRVTGALELFENDFVHLRSGVDQRSGDDRERTALLDITRGAKEALRPLQRIGVDTAGQHLARARDDGVVGAAEAS